MPVAVWLNNERRVRLTNELYSDLLIKFINIFSKVFQFEKRSIELIEDNGYEERIVLEVVSSDIPDKYSFLDLVNRAVKESLVFRIVGSSKVPDNLRTRIEFYLNSSERFTNSDILFDTEFDENELLDVLWNDKTGQKAAYDLLEEIRSVRVKFDGKFTKIIETMTVAYDIPDIDNLKNEGVLLYYSSTHGEYSLLDKLIKSYVELTPGTKEKISLFKTKKIASRIYSSTEVMDKLKYFKGKVDSYPEGSFAFISREPSGFSSMVRFMENSIVIPSIRAFPKDTDIIGSAIEEIKKEKVPGQMEVK